MVNFFPPGGFDSVKPELPASSWSRSSSPLHLDPELVTKTKMEAAAQAAQGAGIFFS